MGIQQGKLSAEEFERSTDEKARPVFRGLCKQRALDEGILDPKVVYGYFPVQSGGDELIVYHTEEFSGCTCHPVPAKPVSPAASREWLRFPFPGRKAGGGCASPISSAPTESGQFDVLGLQLVTVGDKATELGRETLGPKTSIRIISTCTASASSRPRRWRSSGTNACGRSWASPAKTPPTSASSSSRDTAAADTASATPPAPTWKQRAKIVELLQPEAIGVTLSENYMLVPEQSTDALVVHHPQAKYFDV